MATEVFDWEVVNDDGFVYKRRKSQHLQISSSTTSASAAPVRPNPAVAELKRKKRVLLRISKKFDKDIEELEAWEKTLNDLKVKSKIEQQKSSDPQPQPQPQQQTQPQPPPHLQSSSGFSSVDQRLSKAEAQEDVIRNVLKHCDVAEALCTAAEERVNQPFFDLPIWAHSPRSLIKSLGEE